jgi:DNA-binding transcriptional MerR regulator
VAIEHLPAAGSQADQFPPIAASAPAGRLYLTSDLRALTGLPRTHMDFYLREGIIRPTTRTGSGYLLFDETELETLRAVLRWRAEGVGIREIRDRLGRLAN